MATESVAATTTQPESIPGGLIDAVAGRLSKIEAIANMLMQVDPAGMAFGSLSNTAWTLSDLAGEARDMLIGNTEAQS